LVEIVNNLVSATAALIKVPALRCAGWDAF
jgi:hypothetical protein